MERALTRSDGDSLCDLDWIAGQNAGHIAKRFADMHSLAVDDKFADIFVMFGTAHLENGEGASHSPIHLHVTQQYDRIGSGGDMGFGDRRPPEKGRRGGGEEAGYLKLLDGRGEAGWGGLRGARR